MSAQASGRPLTPHEPYADRLVRERYDHDRAITMHRIAGDYDADVAPESGGEQRPCPCGGIRDLTGLCTECGEDSACR